jgi:hypothetical protein
MLIDGVEKRKTYNTPRSVQFGPSKMLLDGGAQPVIMKWDDQQMFYRRYIAKPIYLHDLQFRTTAFVARNHQLHV